MHGFLRSHASILANLDSSGLSPRIVHDIGRSFKRRQLLRNRSNTAQEFCPVTGDFFTSCRRILGSVLILTLSIPVGATTVILDVRANKIIVVADSRAVDTNLNSKTVRDDKCKIVVLGNEIAFAETGQEGYTPAGVRDPVPGWHGTVEAINAYNGTPDHEIDAVAKTWAIQVTDNFQRFYGFAPQRVRGLTVQGVLMEGLFSGTNREGKVQLYLARVALDDTLQTREGASIPIGYSVDLLPPKDRPYTTNAVTQELLDNKTERAKKSANLWTKTSIDIPLADRRLRWLEFLAEETSKYDPEVHAPINAVEIRPKLAFWLQNKTCHTP